jgi:hypothetical protein
MPQETINIPSNNRIAELAAELAMLHSMHKHGQETSVVVGRTAVHGHELPDGLKQLSTDQLPEKPVPPTDRMPRPGLTVKEQKLLSRVVSYYQHTHTQDKRGIN